MKSARKIHRKNFNAFSKYGAGGTKQGQCNNGKTPENNKQTNAAHTRPHSKNTISSLGKILKSRVNQNPGGEISANQVTDPHHVWGRDEY